MLAAYINVHVHCISCSTHHPTFPRTCNSLLGLQETEDYCPLPARLIPVGDNKSTSSGEPFNDEAGGTESHQTLRKQRIHSAKKWKQKVNENHR